MPYAKVNNITLYYEIHGEGEPIILINGLGTSSTSLLRYIPIFTNEYKAVFLDTRGTGRSDKPDIPYTMEMMADDIEGLLDCVGIQAAHIYGISMGGIIAQHFGLRYPTRTLSLILACTSFGGPHAIQQNDEDMNEQADTGSNTNEKEMWKALLRLTMSDKFINENPGIINKFIVSLMEYPTPPHGFLRQRQAIENHDTYDRLPEVIAPTLVIHGDIDRLTPVENAKIMASRIPNAELVIFDNMGHGFWIEAFDETNRVIWDFLKRHSQK